MLRSSTSVRRRCRPCARTGSSGSCKSFKASRYLAREAASGSSDSAGVDSGWAESKAEEARRSERTILASRARGGMSWDEVEEARVSSCE